MVHKSTSHIRKHFSTILEQIKGEERYRSFTELQPICGQTPKAILSSNPDATSSLPYSTTSTLDKGIRRDITVWCNNDYLGMSQHPLVIEAAIGTIRKMGVGAGGTRNIGGNHCEIVALERELSELHGKEAALVFTSGYVANQAALGSLGKIIPNGVIFSDQHNHASIIHGIKDSKLEKRIFPHNDMHALEELLREYPLELPKVIVFEAVYSMSGNVAPFAQLCDLAQLYNALLYADEVHSVGLYGPGGAGMASMHSCAENVDIIQGTLSKAYGTIGGYIAADRVIIDAIRSIAPGFIFTTAIPPSIAAAASTSIRHLRSCDTERIKQRENVYKVRQLLSKNFSSYLLPDYGTHIVVLLVRDARISRDICQDLLHNYGIYLQNINFPTVPRGDERLRITPGPHHTDADIEHLITSLTEVWQRYIPISS